MPAVKPILKYPGAKWGCAEWVISHFPPHHHYVEPFFGSGAVFFNKEPVKHEVINDLSGDVCNLFRVIRERGTDLAALIEMTPWAREEYERSYEATDDPLERARRFVVRVWQSQAAGSLVAKNGWAHHGVILPYTVNVIKWSRVPASVLSLTHRLRYADIEQKDAITVASEYRRPDVLIYADPPYPLSTRAGKMYQHEMADEDHMVLLDTLDAHPGPVVLSGYSCPLYDDRLAHWARRTKDVQAERGGKRTEVLWLNPVCVEQLGYGPIFEAQP